MAGLASLRRMRRPARISMHSEADAIPAAPLGGTKSEAVHRLQLGVSGLVGILVLVGLASIIEDRAKQVERDAVPEAIASPPPSATPSKPDPLAEAGVVPDLPASPAASATPAAPILPEQGTVPDHPPPANNH